MASFVFCTLIMAGLFVAAYVTKRRFGVLGLALAAGSILSQTWAATLTPLLEEQGITLIMPPLSFVVQALLILGPPILLLFSGPSYNKTPPRIASALGFALLAFAFLLPSMATALRLEGPGLVLFNIFKEYQNLIIVVGLLGAIADMLVTRQSKNHKSAH